MLIRREPESFLPLNKVENPVQEEDVLDLSEFILANLYMESSSSRHIGSDITSVRTLKRHFRWTLLCFKFEFFFTFFD